MVSSDIPIAAVTMHPLTCEYRLPGLQLRFVVVVVTIVVRVSCLVVVIPVVHVRILVMQSHPHFRSSPYVCQRLILGCVYVHRHFEIDHGDIKGSRTSEFGVIAPTYRVSPGELSISG